MVATIDRTPDLIPVPPEWMARQQQAGAPNQNRNINDIYWQKPNGWIVVGPSAVRGPDGRPLTAQAEGLMRRGWKPLVEYSYTNRISDKTGHRETIELNADKLNTPDRYYWLFANGGAHLFTIEQIVEHHWHITPPFGLPKSVFPQLQEWEVPEPYYCPACPGTRPPKNSEEQVSTHLMVEHRMTLNQVRDLQSQTNGFRDQPRGSAGVAIRRKAQQQEAAVTRQEIAPSPDQPRAQIRICNACGEPIEGTDGFAVARHNKTCSAKSSSEEASPVEGREE
ncbi:MAG TPA: hypothetical protein VLA89_00235 [Gemmatimonadales bacterium]|nr:hypothetical protein [Gemmatimonadales bacterium]